MPGVIPVGGEWGRVSSHPVPLRVIYDLAPIAGPGGNVVVTDVTGAAAVMRVLVRESTPKNRRTAKRLAPL